MYVVPSDIVRREFEFLLYTARQLGSPELEDIIRSSQEKALQEEAFQQSIGNGDGMSRILDMRDAKEQARAARERVLPYPSLPVLS